MVFLEVNGWILLSLFLVYLLGCIVACQRMLGWYDTGCAKGSMLWKLLFCGMIAVILMVLTVYLWFLVVALLMILTRQLCRKYSSDRMKLLITTGMTVFMILVAVAGLQVMLDTDEEEEDAESEEAVVVQIEAFSDSSCIWRDFSV